MSNSTHFTVERKILVEGSVLVCDNSGRGLLLPKAAADTCLMGQRIRLIPQFVVAREFAIGIING